MENYTITKYQIEKLADEDSIVKELLKGWFPESFKTELEIGKWYKYKLALFYVTNKISNHTNYYNVFGFDVDGNWMTDNAKTWFDENYIEATPEEVEEALIKQGGYKIGLKTKCLVSQRKIVLKGKPFYRDGKIYADTDRFTGYAVLFIDGEFSKILHEEKTVITKERDLKIIAKKMKVSPENIEIKN